MIDLQPVTIKVEQSGCTTQNYLKDGQAWNVCHPQWATWGSFFPKLTVSWWWIWLDTNHNTRPVSLPLRSLSLPIPPALPAQDWSLTPNIRTGRMLPDGSDYVIISLPRWIKEGRPCWLEVKVNCIKFSNYAKLIMAAGYCCVKAGQLLVVV